MTTTQASAPAKVILFGEHAVVYGRPAIAAPVSQVRATALVADSAPTGVRLVAPDIGEAYWLADAGEEDPLAAAVRSVQEAAGRSRLPNLTITVRSNIPVASGLGSGAATAAALIRALALHLERPDLASNESVSSLTYEVETLHHGTPSGIDNTVVAYERPVYFIRRSPENQIDTFRAGRPLRLLIADTGIRSSTRDVVSDVRRQWQAEPERFEEIFTACGRIADAARRAIEAGDLERVGSLMQENQVWLRQMTVSSTELDRLAEAAGEAGALGAKLSGAGRGGNIIALVTESAEAAVRQALSAAGALKILATTVR
ncbi:MAG: mevalonate kinase [Candidatus Promineifilaceae bacterium]|nr:mevalonate kinase [Candidatus Promineifilaceae bacterium]